MPVRKHEVEFALNFYSDGMLLVHPKDITDLDDPASQFVELAESCHIYLILKRPRLTFQPGSLEVGEDRTSVRVKYVKDGVETEATMWLEGHANAEVVQVSEYPHTSLVMKTGNTVTHTLPAHTLSFLCDEISDPSVRDLEVAYVGMSYADGTRSAKDRLRNHSTLQQVLADLNGSEPQNEALLLLVAYSPMTMIMSIDGRSEPPAEDSRVLGRDISRAQNEITTDLQIALIEAGLIRYFQPPYNEKYKLRFPHPTQKLLEEMYSIDFGGLIVEINTEDVNARLYSQARAAGYHHSASVDLHDPSVRQSFFNIMNVENGPDASTFSGPIY